MRVMAAGMHDINLAAIGQPLFRRCRVRQAGGFANRIRIHIGAEPDGWAGAVFQHANHAGLAHPFGDRKA